MAGGRGTVGQSGHHLVHKPKSGPRLLAWAVRHILFPLALREWQRKEDARLYNRSHLCGSTYDATMTRARLSHTLNCIFFCRKNSQCHYPTTLRDRRAPCAIAQADGGAKAPQLKTRIAAESDACPRVMEQTLCGSMGGHRRPVASHN